MPKRVEVNLDPVNPLYFQIMKDVGNSPDTTLLEKQLAGALWEIGLKFNELLLRLEHGLVSVSDAPPEPCQYSRRSRDDR